MAVLFAGNEPESYSNLSSNVLWGTVAGSYDPDYSRGSCAVAQASDYLRVDFGDQTEFWLHMRHRTTGSVGISGPLVRVLDSAGNSLFALRQAGSTSTGLGLAYYTTATTVTDISPTLTYAPSSTYILTMHVKLVATNQALIEFYSGGVLISSATITSSWLGTKKPASIRLGTTYAGFQAYFSEVIITDTEDPRGWRVATLTPNGNGASGDWSGSYVDIDEIGHPDDNDFISSDTAGQVELFSLSNLSSPAQNMAVKAVSLSARARVGAGGPQNIQPGVRVGGADYFGGSFAGLTAAFSNRANVWGVNPATSSPWTVADVQSLEAGFKSVA